MVLEILFIQEMMFQIHARLIVFQQIIIVKQEHQIPAEQHLVLLQIQKVLVIIPVIRQGHLLMAMMLVAAHAHQHAHARKDGMIVMVMELGQMLMVVKVIRSVWLLVLYLQQQLIGRIQLGSKSPLWNLTHKFVCI